MATNKTLPDGFEELAHWGDDWALSTENLRRTKRLSSTYSELQLFYASVLPLLEKMLSHCDQFELQQLPEESASLFDLALMLSEVAPSVERYKAVGVPFSFPEEKFVASHGNALH